MLKIEKPDIYINIYVQTSDSDSERQIPSFIFSNVYVFLLKVRITSILSSKLISISI